MLLFQSVWLPQGFFIFSVMLSLDIIFVSLLYVECCNLLCSLADNQVYVSKQRLSSIEFILQCQEPC